MSKRVRRPGLRWHLALTYLVTIWVTLTVVTVFVSRSLEKGSMESRKAYLYAHAHLMAKTIRSRGGPEAVSVSATVGVPSRARTLVVDSLGRVLEDSALDPGMLGVDLTGLEEVRGAIQGQQVANTYYLPDRTYVMYLAVPADWGAGTGAVFLSQDLGDIVAQYQSLMRTVLVGGALASLASLALAWFLSRLVTGPILELAESARRMSFGRLDLRVRPRGPKETRVLAESFNTMAEEMERTERAKREFFAAAAHELRSPLAALSVLVESMQAMPPRGEELTEFLSDMKSELGRIIKTSEGILDLLRAGEHAVLGFADPVAEVSDLVRAHRRSTYNDVSIELQVEGFPEPGAHGSRGRAEAQISPVLLRLIASNLLDNAVKYSESGGEVTVRCRKVDNDFALSVQDSGMGISPAELPRVFERFYRVDSSRQKATGGSGLGLSIVKEAVDRTGAVISVDSELGRGSTFAVTWKGVYGHGEVG